MIYVSSDQHIGHFNVLKLCNRSFSSIEEHDGTIIDNHNSIVSDSDTVWNLGDFAFRCSASYAASSIKRMNGNIKLILGNHDKPIRQAYKKGLLKDILDNGKLEIIGGELAINDPTLAISKMITIDKQKVFLSHYSYRTWPNAFRDAIHLFGHSHSNLSSYFKSFDIGVDIETKTHKRFYPWSWDEIVNEMNQITADFKEG